MKLYILCGCLLHSFDSDYGSMVSSHERSKEPSGSIKDKVFLSACVTCYDPSPRIYSPQFLLQILG
jgi:hypothetical protein